MWGRKLSVVKDRNYHCVGERCEVRGTFYKAGAGLGKEGDEKDGIEWLAVKY